MKKIINWLAEISGVALDIRIREMKVIGRMMRSDQYWWNGGGRGPMPNVKKVFILYSDMLLQGIYPDVHKIRDQVYKEFPVSNPFVVAEVKDLLEQVQTEKISFSRFVEILNERKNG